MSKAKNLTSNARAGETKERVSPARIAAFEVLRRVEGEGAFAAPLLATMSERLSGVDRALAYELVMGVLRHQLWLDCVVAHFAGRAVEKLDAGVSLALRLGLYQMRFLERVPDSAAVNESVALVRRAHLASAAGFVNAVLRRAGREAEYDPTVRAKTDAERTAIATSHPVWLIERWSVRFGASEAASLAEANNHTPPVAFRINDQDETSILAELNAAETMTEITVEPSAITPRAWRAKGAGATLQNMARDGRIYLQDEASQLVAHIVAPRAGENILDVCAAPGSKTTHISVLGEANRNVPDGAVSDGVCVVAGDLHSHRLRVLRELAGRQRLERIFPVVYDAERALPFRDGSFDAVLVDAPCSGTGTLRHNPEIRWRIAPSDIDDLSERQARILTNAATLVRDGGRLIYSTCSIEHEENEWVIEGFLNANREWQVERPKVLSSLISDDDFARTFPHRDDTEGFFIAVMRRAAWVV
ncbi:MAG: 16S rRNA (cytosine(967)-C(5))-methyltransferase RsmB [Pyrinomonadaceae bacterium MAG19_C2-C3]|nr:16S rRNA (cytosine(967)-C(5))-methyltransferase RsmB [Pyrinomonadaceae bacterium MAG19_C2-C3]